MQENGLNSTVDLGTKKGAEMAIRHPEAVTEMDTEAKCFKLIEGGMSPQQVLAYFLVAKLCIDNWQLRLQPCAD